MKKYIVMVFAVVSAAFGQGCATPATNTYAVKVGKPLLTPRPAPKVRQVCILPKEHLSQENDFLPKPCPNKYYYNNFGTKEVTDSQWSTSTATPYINYRGQWDTLKNTSSGKTHTETPIYPTPVYNSYYGVQPGATYYSGSRVSFGYSQPVYTGGYGGGNYYVRPNSYVVRP